MKAVYVFDDWDKRGGPLFVVGLLLKMYGNVVFEKYDGQEEGVLLSYNSIPEGLPASLRKVLFIAGYSLARNRKAASNGLPRKNPWKEIDHVVFNSHLIKAISLSGYKDIGERSVIHVVGGAHADGEAMRPKEKGRSLLNDEIHFMAIAKWWKERAAYKRKKQTLTLFNNFILKKYPNSVLHMLGNVEETKRHDNIIFYRKSFHNTTIPKIYNKAHIQIMLSAFESGPMTLSESMHYRVPFVCSNNSCGKEFIKRVDGICGEMVNTDRLIRTADDCVQFRPMTDKLFYNKKKFRYSRIMNKIEKVVNDYDTYTSWKWTKDFNYQSQCDKWLKVLNDS